MTSDYSSILSDPVVVAALSHAWADTHPGISGGQEEGGFIIQGFAGKLDVVRWPKGTHNTIELPRHNECKVDGAPIVASFHTHPNLSREYMQEPSETDGRAVRDDPDLKGKEYVGEFVVTLAAIYLILPSGQVRNIARTQDVLQGL